MTPEAAGALVTLRDNLQFPFSVSYADRHLYLFCPYGPFYTFSEIDVFDDLSKPKFYLRRFEDYEKVMRVIEAFEVFRAA